MERVRQIGRTPLSVSVYSAESTQTKINDPGVLEIIFCLTGSVRFSYAYEEFTLEAGEFVSVDKDAYYLYKGRDNRCVSFFIDLNRYTDRYPYICTTLFVCEGMREGTTQFPARYYSMLKGLLISVLKEITGPCREETVMMLTDHLVDLFITRFNIYYYHYGSHDIEPVYVERLERANDYIFRHIGEKITLKEISEELNVTEGYASELMRKYGIGFRVMVNYLRANASEEYLLKTDLTVMEISERCGFSDPKYYYAAFKRWYRCTPRQFRERYVRDMATEISYLPLDSVRELLDDLLVNHYQEIFVEGSGL